MRKRREFLTGVGGASTALCAFGTPSQAKDAAARTIGNVYLNDGLGDPSERIDWAQSYSAPPSLQVKGARLDFPSYSPERRALRLIVDTASIEIDLKPATRYMNPVFELDQAPKELESVTIDGVPLPSDAYAWDGKALWMKARIGKRGVKIDLRVRGEKL